MVDYVIIEKITINEDKPFLMLYLIVIILITLVVTLFRIMTYFIPLDSSPTDAFIIFLHGKDEDFRMLRIWMNSGLYNMYIPPPGYIFGHFYLYHFYFIFFPFYILPLDISVYIWDVLRLLAVFYIAFNISKITKKQSELLLVLGACAIGYAVDMFLNNSNWLILLLLFESYRQIQKERKILSGILFTIATFKIIVLVFPFILLITKKIKIKEIIYYIAPFFILFIPYIVNPSFYWQMYTNWTVSDLEGSSVIIPFFYTILKIFEPAQLMFVSFGVFLIYVNIENKKWNKRANFISFIVLLTMFVFYLSLLGTFTSNSI